MMGLLRFIGAWLAWLFQPPVRQSPERVNPLARIQKHFGLKSKKDAQRMIDEQDPRLFTLPPDTLDRLGLYVRNKHPWYKRLFLNLRARWRNGLRAVKRRKA